MSGFVVPGEQIQASPILDTGVLAGQREWSIPAGKVDGYASVHVSRILDQFPECSSVELNDDKDIRLYLGSFSLTMPARVWRPIVDALSAALGEAGE